MKAAVLNDLTMCNGCGACAMACKQINDLPGKATKLDGYTWCCVEKHGEVYVKRQCMHCQDPTCASVCPVTALYKTETGAVTYDAGKCMGCRYCMQACPFDMPRYQWDSPVPAVSKCVMCYGKRLKEGREPACTGVCPTGATRFFTDRDEALREARRRVAANPGRYIKHIYGEKEAGGTSVLYLSAVPFKELGFRTDVLQEEYPKLSWRMLSKLPPFALVLGAGLAGTSWVIDRRVRFARKRKEHGEDGR